MHSSDLHNVRSQDLEAQQLASGEAGLYNNSIGSYSWKNITVTVSGKDKVLLDNVSGEARAGELIALMGPSGSGKTTLLNVLARRPTPGLKTEGHLAVDDNPIPNRREFNAISSFVEQEDRLIGSLTARETVDFAARMAETR